MKDLTPFKSRISIYDTYTTHIHTQCFIIINPLFPKIPEHPWEADQCVLFEEERDKSGDKFQWSMRKDLGVIDVLTQLMIGIFGYKVS